MKKRVTSLTIALVMLISGTFFISAGDNYFEISKNLDIFASLYREINTNYVDDTKPGALMKTGIEAMLETLDPYTNFIPESKIEDYRFMTTGQYGGIGALIQKRGDKIMVTETYDDFPAQKAGLFIGDEIIEIDGNSTEGKNTSDISEILKGQPDTEVNIKVLRGVDEAQKEMSVKLKRAEIKIHDVPYYAMLDDKIGYIRLTSFTHTASVEFLGALKDLKENQGMESLIIDLRGNGGGLLMESVAIVNFFVKKGTPVVKTKGKLKEWEQLYKAESNPYDAEIPIAVLVNGLSASASEIVAGSFQDLDRAVIIGQETFGKGLVQQTVDLSYNSKLKVTVAKYYTPSGRCIQKINYADRNAQGKAQQIPDSLIEEFKSLTYGRKLYDGNGINPDIAIDEMDLSNISIGLLENYHFFDFATKYRLEVNEISDPDKYKVDEGTLASFKKYIDEKEFSYDTRAEDLLSRLKEITEDEHYYNDISAEYGQLEAKLSDVKNGDFEKHADEISDLLAAEIVLRYHHQQGQLKYGLANDQFIDEAKEVLNNKEKYNSILQGTFKSEE